jgi:hypothetical protein
MQRRDAGRALDARDADGRENEVLETVRKAIRGIEYGSVLIKIHQGDVVGIETSTKLRLREPPRA